MNKINKSVLAIVISLIIFEGCATVSNISSYTSTTVKALLTPPVKIVDRIFDPRVDNARLAVTWIGQATVLIQIDDKYILTDPNFTETVGMFVKRRVEPGIDPENLPDLDVVLISHMHFDHLSLKSLDLISSKTDYLILPQQGLVYIPNYDFESTELISGNSWRKEGLEITAVPVKHNGARYGLDKEWMTKSFTGYIIRYHGITVFFSGDTGYDPDLFKEISKKYPDIDLALLPIAPIHPRESMKAMHTDPVEAVQIYTDLGAKYLMPIHFDTYYEPVDSLGEVQSILDKTVIEEGINEEHILLLDIGEQKVIYYKGQY